MSRFPDRLRTLAIGLAVVGGIDAARADKLGIGREATPEEISAWAIGVRPDGQGLPPGSGTAAKGEDIFQTRCAPCHGEFGEGKDRWPELAGGQGTLKHDRPFKTIGSYWPFATTIFDYVHRAMPFGNAQSLSNDELYSVTAYLLQLNDVVTDPNFEINKTTLPAIKMPNAAGFYNDDRETTEKAFWNRKACMTDCKADVKVVNRATVLDVTPDKKTGPKVD